MEPSLPSASCLLKMICRGVTMAELTRVLLRGAGLPEAPGDTSVHSDNSSHVKHEGSIGPRPRPALPTILDDKLLACPPAERASILSIALDDELLARSPADRVVILKEGTYYVVASRAADSRLCGCLRNARSADHPPFVRAPFRNPRIVVSD